MKYRDVYNASYFRFILTLVERNVQATGLDDHAKLCSVSIELATKFLLNTYLRTHQKLRLRLALFRPRDEKHGALCAFVRSLANRSGC